MDDSLNYIHPSPAHTLLATCPAHPPCNSHQAGLHAIEQSLENIEHPPTTSAAAAFGLDTSGGAAGRHDPTSEEALAVAFRLADMPPHQQEAMLSEVGTHTPKPGFLAWFPSSSHESEPGRHWGRTGPSSSGSASTQPGHTFVIQHAGRTPCQRGVNAGQNLSPGCAASTQ